MPDSVNSNEISSLLKSEETFDIIGWQIGGIHPFIKSSDTPESNSAELLFTWIGICLCLDRPVRWGDKMLSKGQPKRAWFFYGPLNRNKAQTLPAKLCSWPALSARAYQLSIQNLDWSGVARWHCGHFIYGPHLNRKDYWGSKKEGTTDLWYGTNVNFSWFRWLSGGERLEALRIVGFKPDVKFLS